MVRLPGHIYIYYPGSSDLDLITEPGALALSSFGGYWITEAIMIRPGDIVISVIFDYVVNEGLDN